MSVSAFVDGAAGTTGLEIRERLADRPGLSLVVLDEARRKDEQARAGALNAADFVILCLPDDAAREAVRLIVNPRTRVIDASSAHRVMEGWVYGFPELDPGQADLIAAARFVSNPGCYPTGFLALVRPLVRAGLIPADWPLSVNATSGYSGGGKGMIAAFEDATSPHHTGTAFRAYALDLTHKHLPEMQVHAGLIHPPIFQPAVARSYRGMLIEVPLALYALPGRPALADVRTVLREAYRGSPTVRFVDGDGTMPIDIEEKARSDSMALRVCGNAERGQARLIATLDNLGKGAAGAAVQNLNLMAGFEPLAGLVV